MRDGDFDSGEAIEIGARILAYLAAVDSDSGPHAEKQPPAPVLDEEDEAVIREILAEHQAMNLRGLQSGRLHTALVRTAMRVRDSLEQKVSEGRSWLNAPLNVANVLAYGLRALPRTFFPALEKWTVRWFPGNRQTRVIRSAIYSRGLPVGALLPFVRDLPQAPECVAFGRNTRDNIVVASAIGVDILPSDGRWVVIEVNTGGGQNDQWEHRVDRNWFVDNMMQFASSNGFSKVVVINNDRGLHPDQQRDYTESAARHHVAVAIIEPSSLPASQHARSSTIPALCEPDTLCVRIRDFPSWADFALSDKRHVHEVLDAHIAGKGIDNVVQPDSAAGWLDRVQWESGPFPNVVCKIPDADKGVGIAFYKARDKAHALEMAERGSSADFRVGGVKGALTRSRKSGDRILQAYVPGDVNGDGRLVKYRMNMLVSPIGSRMLSVVTITSPVPLPDDLAYGVVEDPYPYLANSYPGSYRGVATPEELVELGQVAQVIGDALSADLEKHFRADLD